ncbi:MAG TPA: hypothetical protein VE999_03670 [Gemmataceae bacterium]|nr:hypothetical protein [Gemmataceae bacterium]
MIQLNNSAIVVAHPDDEVLWFGSVVDKVSRVIVCYGPNPAKPERAFQRLSVANAYPLSSLVFLNLTEPKHSGWFRHESGQRDELASRLSPALDGITTVFTHNAWGEYGHPDHLLLHAVVNDLQSSIGFEVFHSCYVELRKLDVLRSVVDKAMLDFLSASVDPTAIDPIVRLYKQHKCWTWYDDWVWPSTEHFIRSSKAGIACPKAIPFIVFKMIGR